MKSLKEIENMSLEDMETISSDEDIVIPEGFRNRIEAAVNAEVIKKRNFRFIGAAAVVLLLIGAGIGIGTYMNEPKDTFDDPYLAYAEIEKAFAMMSGEIQKGLASIFDK